MMIPNWLNSYLTSEQTKFIEQAVKQAEEKTTGEVVPMVVHRSSTVGHVPVILMFALGLMFFAFDLDHYQRDLLPLPHWLLIVGDLLILTIAVRWLSTLSFLQRMLTSRSDQTFQVEQRAINEFYNHRVDRTDKATGILILVSIMEHQAVVLGDKSIAEKIDPKTWGEVVQRLIQGIKEKDLSGGFCEAILMCGPILEEHFPGHPQNINELENHLIIRD